MSPGSAALLAPGFRFHPTDEELVRYYLKRKILNKPSFDAISVIDIYKSEPWDLPDKSKLKSRDLEWYFFSAPDKKYGNGSRTNRATDRGYWKTTGKDRAIRHRERVVGMKKTLVYHKGRAPSGERTNWVMHEYRLTDEDLEKAGIQQDAFVLCRVFQKSGSGPRNGEQYGAPFIEEEWEHDEAVFVPGQHAEAVYEEVANDDAFVEVNDIDRNLDISKPSENSTLPLNIYHGESSNHVGYSREFSEDNQKQPGNMSENAFLPSNFYYGESSNQAEHSRDFSDGYQKPTGMQATESDSEPHHEHVVSDIHRPNDIAANGKTVKDEFVLDPIENVNPVNDNYLLEEPYLDVADYLPTNDEFFLEANDLSNPITGMQATESDSKPHHEHVICDMLKPKEIAANGKTFKDEFVLNPIENFNPADNKYLLEEPYLDVADYLPTTDEIFLETNDLLNPITGTQAVESDSKPHHEHAVSDMLRPNEIATNGKTVKDEFVLNPMENFNPADNNYLLEEPYLDVTDYLPTNDEFFLEANDLSNPIYAESEFFDLDKYFTFIDADDQLLSFDSDQRLGSEIPVSGQEPVAEMHPNGGIEQVSNASEYMEEHGNNNASSSKLDLEATKFEPGTKYPFIKQASHLLGSFPAPPAFACEFPSKDAALKLNSAAHASSSVHVMAGVIRITNTTSSGNGLAWLNSKHGNVNVALSFSLPQGDINPYSFLPMASLLSGKTGSLVPRSWFFLMFWVLIISVSLKFGTCYLCEVTHTK